MRRTMIAIEDIGRGNTGGNKLLDSIQIKKKQHEQSPQAEKIWHYSDGRIMEILAKDGTDVWYFSNGKKWRERRPDGTDIWFFPNGKKWRERRPDGSVKIFNPDGTPREFISAHGFRYWANEEFFNQ